MPQRWFMKRVVPPRILCACIFFFLFMNPPTQAQTKTNEVATKWLKALSPTPELDTPSTRRAWEGKRKEIRSRLWELLGNLPSRPKVPAVTTLSREDRGDYIVEKFQFDNGAGAVVRGYLVLPGTSAKKAPAIQYCHWHGGQYDIGKEEIFQAEHTPEVPAVAFAKRGYALIAIDAYCFGERNGQGPAGPNDKGSSGEMSASKFNLWAGRTLWGMMLRDELMALDYLCSRPEIDASRIGVTGMSMGATRSWWLMALDERIKTGVPVACMTRYQNLIAHNQLPAHGIYYFVPNMLQHFDTEAVIALIAPRPVLFMTGDADKGSPVDGIRALESKVKEVYQLYGKVESFRNEVYPGLGHKYLPEMWVKTLNWMDQHLSR